MRRFFAVMFCGVLMATSANAALDMDTSDPLYMVQRERVLSQTSLTFWDDTLRGGQTLSYGLNDRLNVGANVHYQEDFSSNDDGFSSLDLGAVYRMTEGRGGDLTYDVLFGLKVGGSSHVRTPYYADSTYYAGLRLGRQMAGVTLAATIKSSWIFDDDRGMAYIDFMPTAYFRIDKDWRVGANFIWRKATNPHYDQEWIGARVIRQFGRTQYIGHLDYEFESDDVQVGAQINILF